MLILSAFIFCIRCSSVECFPEYIIFPLNNWHYPTFISVKCNSNRISSGCLIALCVWVTQYRWLCGYEDSFISLIRCGKWNRVFRNKRLNLLDSITEIHSVSLHNQWRALKKHRPEEAGLLQNMSMNMMINHSIRLALSEEGISRLYQY